MKAKINVYADILETPAKHMSVYKEGVFLTFKTHLVIYFIIITHFFCVNSLRAHGNFRVCCCFIVSFYILNVNLCIQTCSNITCYKFE